MLSKQFNKSFSEFLNVIDQELLEFK